MRVEVCGVCRTDLHVVEGDLEPRRAGIVPGHEVVARVSARGEGAARFREGDRVGVACDETTTYAHLEALWRALAAAAGGVPGAPRTT